MCSFCAVHENQRLLQVNKIGNKNIPIQRSATASDKTNQLAVVRSRLLLAISQITSALPATAKLVGNQPAIQNQLCIFCTIVLSLSLDNFKMAR